MASGTGQQFVEECMPCGLATEGVVFEVIVHKGWKSKTQPPQQTRPVLRI